MGVREGWYCKEKRDPHLQRRPGLLAGQSASLFNDPTKTRPPSKVSTDNDVPSSLGGWRGKLLWFGTYCVLRYLPYRSYMRSEIFRDMYFVPPAADITA